MIIQVREKNKLNLQAYDTLVNREWRNESATVNGQILGGPVWRPAPLMVEFRKMLLPMPLLFLSGVFAGVGIMLALN